MIFQNLIPVITKFRDKKGNIKEMAVLPIGWWARFVAWIKWLFMAMSLVGVGFILGKVL